MAPRTPRVVPPRHVPSTTSVELNYRQLERLLKLTHDAAEQAPVDDLNRFTRSNYEELHDLLLVAFRRL